MHNITVITISVYYNNQGNFVAVDYVITNSLRMELVH